jgi:hypothetical protein
MNPINRVFPVNAGTTYASSQREVMQSPPGDELTTSDLLQSEHKQPLDGFSAKPDFNRSEFFIHGVAPDTVPGEGAPPLRRAEILEKLDEMINDLDTGERQRVRSFWKDFLVREPRPGGIIVCGDADGSHARLVMTGIQAGIIALDPTRSEQALEILFELLRTETKLLFGPEQLSDQKRLDRYYALAHQLDLMLKFENGDLTVRFIGDIIWDRLSGNLRNLLLGLIGNMQRVTAPGTVVAIKGNHDTPDEALFERLDECAQEYAKKMDIWARACRAGEMSDMPQKHTLDKVSVVWGMNVSFTKSKAEDGNLYQTRINSLFKNCHYDKGSNILFLHTGLVVEPDRWSERRIFPGFAKWVSTESGNVEELVSFSLDELVIEAAQKGIRIVEAFANRLNRLKLSKFHISTSFRPSLDENLAACAVLGTNIVKGHDNDAAYATTCQKKYWLINANARQNQNYKPCLVYIPSARSSTP